MSSLARIFGVFVSPGRTFEDVAREPHFILCWCIQLAVGEGVALMMVQRVGIYAMARQAMSQSAAFTNASPELQQQMVARTASVMHYTTLFQPFLIVFFLLLFGWIFQGVANFLLGYEARYKQAMSMVSHAYLAQTLLALITMLVLWLNPGSYNLLNPLGTNVGFFLDKASTSPFLYALATHLDIFSLWIVILLGVGVAALGGRKGKFLPAFWSVFGLWLFYVLASSGLTAAFS